MRSIQKKKFALFNSRLLTFFFFFDFEFCSQTNFGSHLPGSSVSGSGGRHFETELRCERGSTRCSNHVVSRSNNEQRSYATGCIGRDYVSSVDRHRPEFRLDRSTGRPLSFDSLCGFQSENSEFNGSSANNAGCSM